MDPTGCLYTPPLSTTPSRSSLPGILSSSSRPEPLPTSPTSQVPIPRGDNRVASGPSTPSTPVRSPTRSRSKRPARSSSSSSSSSPLVFHPSTGVKPYTPTTGSKPYAPQPSTLNTNMRSITSEVKLIPIDPNLPKAGKFSRICITCRF